MYTWGQERWETVNGVVRPLVRKHGEEEMNGVAGFLGCFVLEWEWSCHFKVPAVQRADANKLMQQIVPTRFRLSIFQAA